MTQDFQTRAHSTNKITLFSLQVLHGLSQIMLQKNPLTGVLILIAIAASSLTAGIATLFATICGTATALWISRERQAIFDGLYGFNAALVGVALTVFFKPALIIWILIAVGAACTTLTHHFFIRKKIPAFTLAFVLVTWIIYYSLRTYAPQLMNTPSSDVSANYAEMYFIPLKGFAQVVFQSAIISGILLVIGVALNSLMGALYGILAAIAGALVAYYTGGAEADILNGLFGYNAVLCALAFSGKKLNDLPFVAMAVGLGIFFNQLLDNTAVLQLTFPFVVASFITQTIKSTLQRQ
ncbi:MAG: urea transporter [Chitinophagales bacterium]|nr:urea transporter [Chitinophagales bacterium]